MNTVSVAICTGMGHDLSRLLESLACTDCDEILIIGTQGYSFLWNERFNDPRIKMFYARHPQSYKRHKALCEAKGDIIAFVDDDAVVPDNWVKKIRSAFDDASIGVVTGPSLLPAAATLWKRTAQLAMASSQYSRRRYSACKEGVVEWFDIIGANMAFRKAALEQAGIDTESFPSYGEEMIIAFNVFKKGWKVYYSPEAFVLHQPHGFWRQLSQIHNWGRAEVRLIRAGVQYPKRDLAYVFYIPVLCAFACAYVCGEIKQKLIGDSDVRAGAWFKRMLHAGIRKCLRVSAKPHVEQ